jgi:triacylglycerol lipase
MRDNGGLRMATVPNGFTKDLKEANLSIWTEALFAAELLLLHATPVYYGFGLPRGDDSGVVVIPGFLGTDVYLMELNAWLRRIGYRPYFSGIGLNAECPNLLIQRRLNETINQARSETQRRVHVIGHSLGGIIGRAIADQRPQDIASVIMMGTPIRGAIAHGSVLRAAEAVRKRIQAEHGAGVLPDCYTGHCTCDFINSLRRDVPPSVPLTSIYTRHDGVVDWRSCLTGDSEVDCEVSGTHIGLAFNPSVYAVIATRLAKAHSFE